jgi:GNAT superfamily N-acetyltransferase
MAQVVHYAGTILCPQSPSFIPVYHVGMDVNSRDFIERVRALYEDNPGYISSIPFWKLEEMLARSRTHETVEGANTCLYAVDGDRLVFYWSDNSEEFMLTPEDTASFSFLVLHEDFYRLAETQLTHYEASPTYTLFYDFSFEDANDAGSRAAGYSLTGFDFGRDQEYEALADLIKETDSHYRLTGERARQWTKSPAFDPALWLWAVERGTGSRVGAAVSNHNPGMRETDLDWFYVLPVHQGKGIGRMLVRETIDRSKERSKVIRLGGVADEFYMKCGFRRKDKWFIVRKRSLTS